MRVAYIHMLIPIVNIFSYLETDKFSFCNTRYEFNFLKDTTKLDHNINNFKLSYNIALLHVVPLDSVSLNSLSSGWICFQKSLYITLIHQIPSTWSIEDTCNLKWRQCNIGWHSKQSIWHIELSKLTWEPSSFKIFQKNS